MDNKYTRNNRFIKHDNIEPLTYDYMMNRNCGLPKEYFKYSDIMYNPNEIQVHRTHRNRKIHEGLTKTYPTKQTLNHVCNELQKRGYPITPDMFRLISPDDKNEIYGHVLISIELCNLNKEIDDVLKQTFNTCGYHLGTTFSRIDSNNQQCTVYQFEPKFQDNVKDSTDRYIYHITTDTAAQKILKKGFCPSNRTKSQFNYPARCYFFNEHDTNLFRNYILLSQKKNKSDKDFFNQNFNLITVDLERCPNVKFFTNPNFENKRAIFTYENIPPTAIVKCEDFPVIFFLSPFFI